MDILYSIVFALLMVVLVFVVGRKERLTLNRTIDADLRVIGSFVVTVVNLRAELQAERTESVKLQAEIERLRKMVVAEAIISEHKEG